MRRGVALIAGLVFVTPGPVAGQAAGRPLRALVEYIAGANLYLAAGEEVGIIAGDTLVASGGKPSRPGRVRVIASNDGRSVMTFAGSPFPVTRGDTIVLNIPAERGAAAAAATAAAMARSEASGSRVADSATTGALRASSAGRADSTVNGRDRSTTSAGRTRPPTRGGAGQAPPVQRVLKRPPVRVDGMVAFDFDALDSETRWSDDPLDRVQRRFMTPAMRLYATVSELPAGVQVNTNLRYEYRAAEGTTLGQTTALRVYQASLEKSFDRLPLRFELGRFYNPVDLYGGYWDGGMLRVGGRSAGIGVAAGYEPDRINGGFDRSSPKLSVFADYAYRGPRAGYTLNLSAHDDQGPIVQAGRYVSVSQRLRFGRASVQHRMRLSAADGWNAWTVTQLDLNAMLPLVSSLYVRGHFARRSYDWDLAQPDTIRPQNERKGGGLMVSAGRFSLSTDASLAQWNDGGRTTNYSGSMSIARSPLAGIGLGASANLQQGDGMDSWYVSPWLTRNFGRASVSAAWQRYDATSGGPNEYQAASLSLTLPLPGGAFTSLRAQKQFGMSSSNRIWASLWKSF
jgi:hypothetical protein